MPPNRRHVLHHGDTEILEIFRGAHPREHEELWRAHGTGAEDDLLVRPAAVHLRVTRGGHLYADHSRRRPRRGHDVAEDEFLYGDLGRDDQVFTVQDFVCKIRGRSGAP